LRLVLAGERDHRVGLIEGREKILNRRERIYDLTPLGQGILERRARP
jgi:hypothetical protein